MGKSPPTASPVFKEAKCDMGESCHGENSVKKVCTAFGLGNIPRYRMFLTAVTMKIVFWEVTPCSLVASYQHFGEASLDTLIIQLEGGLLFAPKSW